MPYGKRSDAVAVTGDRPVRPMKLRAPGVSRPMRPDTVRATNAPEDDHWLCRGTTDRDRGTAWALCATDGWFYVNLWLRVKLLLWQRSESPLDEVLASSIRTLNFYLNCNICIRLSHPF